MANLLDVEGIGEIYAGKLRVIGIQTTKDLLKKGSSPQERKKIAIKSDIKKALILEWVNHVDLFRIKGVQEEYADLLEESGVDTVPELAQRNPDNLYNKMKLINKEKKLVRRLPSHAQVKDWIKQAKRLPRIITY